MSRLAALDALEGLSRPAAAVTLVALALGVFLTLGRLGAVPLQRGNEAMYAAPPIRMLETGDYLVPQYEGGDFLEKPPLAWWIVAASYRIFGVSVFAERLPSALAGLATAAALALWARKRSGFKSSAGVLAALVLFSSFEFVELSRTYAADSLLALAVTLAVIALDNALRTDLDAAHRRDLDAAHRRDDGRDLRRGAWAGAALAACFLLKGLMGLVIPIGGAAAGLAIDRRRPVRPLARGAAAFGILFVLVAPWHWAMQRRLGAVFWRSFYWENQFLRATTPLYGHPRPVLYYVGVLAWAMFPWSFLLLAAVRRRTPSAAMRPRALSAAPLGWLAFGLVFCSALVMKREVYLMPLFPAAALLVAENESDPAARRRPLRRAAWGLAAAASVAVLALWVARLGAVSAWSGPVAADLVALGILVTAGALVAGTAAPGASLPAALAALAGGVAIAGVQTIEARLGRFDPLPEWGARVRAECPSGCDAFLYGLNANSLDFYSRLDWTWVADPPRDVPARARSGHGFIVMWSDLEPILARMPFASEVVDRKPAIAKDWVTAMLGPPRAALRSLTLVRFSAAPAAMPQSGGAASAADGPAARVRQAIAPSTTTPPASE